ncbi:hypothetical protein PJ262_02250 [Streptococcus dysgalactiae]|uniref:hypothetical protein n=1 Tax=Streptococcus dysgalactiae TaxID=1334 RepID=UPI0012AA1EDF|nr:hypothetical protein [Streptococcus dysgalactiae]QGH04919.1 hypothetical protein EA458_10975 [Streptococcus dysgalactiae subsp. dysgalactiae]WCE86501.1 hypothetical protein PMN45_02650 [Streptococcus dysgalactiae]WCN26496.1 hypothetical protein PP188_02660 [Streptococcus dysgalactiae]
MKTTNELEEAVVEFLRVRARFTNNAWRVVNDYYDRALNNKIDPKTARIFNNDELLEIRDIILSFPGFSAKKD